MRVEVAPGIFTEATPEVLAELKQLRSVNPLTGYFPLAHQKKFHEAVGKKTPIVALFAGNRAGKTHCAVADDLIQILPREWVPEHLRRYKRWEPPVHIWIGVPKYAKLEEAILPKLRQLCPPSQFLGGKGLDGGYSKQDKIIRLDCGSTIGLKTYDQDVDAYSSASLHRMHWDEEPEGEHGHAIRKEARARLIDHGGDEVLSMTPLLGLSWVYEDVYEPWERGENPNIQCVRADMDDNPYLNEEFKGQFLATLTDEEIEARKEGKFVHFKGLVYGEFEEKHLVDPPSPEHVRNLQTIVGIDPGYRTTGIVFIGFDNENTALIYDELYLHKDDALPGPASEQIKLTLKKWGVKCNHFAIDPMATNASLTGSGENIEEAYRREGIHVVRANNKVEAGVLETKRRLQASPPALLVSRECINWRRERGRYRVDDREDGKFQVVKVFDHLMDASRYGLMERTYFQPPSASKPKRPSYGEQPYTEPPWHPTDSYSPDTTSLGSFT